MQFSWFESFLLTEFEAATRRDHREKAAQALLRIQELWKHWWEFRAAEHQIAQAEAVEADPGLQKEFINYINRWTQRWPRHRQTGLFVLNQLAQTSPFISWAEMRRFRTLEDVPGVNSIMVLHHSDHKTASIRRLTVLAVPSMNGADETSSPPAGARDNHNPPARNQVKDNILSFLYVKAGDAGATSSLEYARDSALSILGGRGLVGLLLCCGIVRVKSKRQWFHILLAVALALVVVSTLFLHIADPYPLLENSTFLLAEHWFLILVSWPFIIYAFVAFKRERARALSQGHRWANLLEESNLCVIVERDRSDVETLEIEGPSAGVSISLAILIAAKQADPCNADKSWLWDHLFNGLEKNLATWACTGEITAFRRILKVKELEKKIEAALAHPNIIHIFVPRQAEARKLRKRIKRGPPHNTKLHIRPRRSLVTMLMRISGLQNRRSAFANIGIAFLFIVFLLALRDIREIAFPPSDPVIDFNESYIGNTDEYGDTLKLRVRTDYPERFRARLKSSIWSNRPDTEFKPEDIPWLSHLKVATFYLSLQPDVEITDQEDLYDGKVSIVRTRSFLFRDLPPAPIETQFIERFKK